MTSKSRRRIASVMILSLMVCTGCQNGLTSGKSLFGSDVPGTSGSSSKEDIIKRANKDPWQPGSPINVTPGQHPGMMR